MAKLYPPHIEGTIPAFTGATIVVPFSMNQAVGEKEIKALTIKIKKVNSNEVILTKDTINFNVYGNVQAVFDLDPDTEQGLFNVGQFYRVQLAFRDKEGILGYFSTVGVIKYTSMPEVSLVGLNRATSNIHLYDYVGLYAQTDDPTEKLYSSRIRLFDDKDNIIEDSGEVVHSVINDIVPNEATELFNIPRDLDKDKTYRLLLTMTSINGVVTNSPKYRIIQRESTDLKFDEIKNLGLTAVNNFDEGYTAITIYSKKPSKEVFSGFFVLSRSEAREPYEWKKIHKFVAKSDLIDKAYMIDKTIEQGKTYVYSLQQYNNYNVYSNRTISNEVYADFEDLFILDGERQLKIRFNPHVSSMKDNILETKSNTIGSKYPFITRNGRVNHKEFSISGLVSYQMDDGRDFMKWEDLGIEFNQTNLISENISAERVFKLEVLSWLNDGKPKILKSPTEGNYIVRIMNVNMSPNDTVGRMLHTFNCNASEIAPFEYEPLTKYNFIGLQEPDKTVSKWKTINFAEVIPDGAGGHTVVYKTGELLDGLYIYSIRLTDMMPGSVFYINGQAYHIGSTGAYMVKTTTPIYSFALPEDAKYSGSMIIEYKDNLLTDFDKIRSIGLIENPDLQLVGTSYIGENNKINIVDVIQDVKTEIISIPKVHFTKREVHKIYVEHNGTDGTFNENSQFYSSGNSIDEQFKIDLSDLEELSLYEIHYSSVDCRIKDIRKHPNLTQDLEYEKLKVGSESEYISFAPKTWKYYDAKSNKIFSVANEEEYFNLFNIDINSSRKINVMDTEELTVKDFDYDYLSMGNGVIADITYLAQVIDYSYEFNHEVAKVARQHYDILYKNYQTNVTSLNYDGNLDRDLTELKEAYKILIAAVNSAILEDYTQGG